MISHRAKSKFHIIFVFCMYIMHFGMVVLLERVADEARRTRNPTLFLDRFSEIHPAGIWGVDNQDFYYFTATLFHTSKHSV